ncbi:hypothetical protein [Rubinisphaera italica]|uniref:Uncharacterized protein n=1 Tax=Rubinisphaera italica TaxID=2527969 RepID=A0A5C5XHE3_9PLAN|nr:hypothetical protein [Rubinisphaera italica]TWT61733.1 hypothetical protein Pan54_24700 [Rubinisphaera italica]
MEINIRDVRNKFDELINGTASREDASEWAQILYDNDEKETLTILTENGKHKEVEVIRDAYLFLLGCDMKNSPNEYLYDITDILLNKP